MKYFSIFLFSIISLSANGYELGNNLIHAKKVSFAEHADYAANSIHGLATSQQADMLAAEVDKLPDASSEWMSRLALGTGEGNEITLNVVKYYLGGEVVEAIDSQGKKFTGIDGGIPFYLIAKLPTESIITKDRAENAVQGFEGGILNLKIAESIKPTSSCLSTLGLKGFDCTPAWLVGVRAIEYRDDENTGYTGAFYAGAGYDLHTSIFTAADGAIAGSFNVMAAITATHLFDPEKFNNLTEQELDETNIALEFGLDVTIDGIISFSLKGVAANTDNELDNKVTFEISKKFDN